MDLKINEKAAIAQKQFMDKCAKLVEGVKGEWQLEACSEHCAAEYGKLYGRFGTNPLLAVKGGKKAPRYLLDRQEVWVIYKPPLWQMGANPVRWEQNVYKLVSETSSLAEAQRKMLEENKASIIQEWHGLTVGLKWIVPTTGDPYHRPVKDWGFVQRLDLETDGPIITAKTWRAQRMLQVQLKEHIFSKAYLCLVHGKVENRLQCVVNRYAELGGTEGTQIMVKHDALNDPFFGKSRSGWWKHRNIRRAKTFLKPIAYYRKKDDQSEYSLVYVNILSGITHQVRITMQSLGHPLVSDDRYLPRDQAMADCQWCPRNFLCEVRQDWFDMCGPYKHPERRRFQRISIENPLPPLFQDILEKKLELMQKLDPTADLYQGPQYWALGDQQLMADFPKDGEFRKKVMRWGIRRGIHLDAMDRLLLLSREHIDRIMTEYKPPEEDEAFWVCPECMNLNHPDQSERSNECQGFGFLTAQKKCQGKPKVLRSTKLPDGWRDYLADPTIHLIWILNPILLEARRMAIEKSRPSWDRPPTEEEGDMATQEQIKSLHAALVQDAKTGGFGLNEEDLKDVAGLETARMPLCLPPDSPVWRMRLPGKGLGSQWRYSLKGKERIRVAANFSVRLKTYKEPILADTDVLPLKAIMAEDQDVAPRSAPVDQWMEEPEEPLAEQDRVKDFQARFKPRESANSKKRSAPEPEPQAPQPEPKRGRPRSWQKVESANGKVFYVDPDTGDISHERLADFQETKPVWEMVESKTAKGVYYYHNHDSGETRTRRPQGVPILNDHFDNVDAATAPAAPVSPRDAMVEEGIPWQRVESRSKPGHFYYFNPISGENEIKPPRVQEPWKLLESATAGQWYYYNTVTGERTEVPPSCAVPASAPPAPRPAPASPVRAMAQPTRPPATDLPEGWEQHLSSQHGKFYYINTRTKETTWTRPPKPANEESHWQRRESSKYPGKFYLQNLRTGETKWT